MSSSKKRIVDSTLNEQIQGSGKKEKILKKEVEKEPSEDFQADENAEDDEELEDDGIYEILINRILNIRKI